MISLEDGPPFINFQSQLLCRRSLFGRCNKKIKIKINKKRE